MYSRVQSKIVTILSIFLIIFGVMASSSTMGLRAICVGVGIVWILEMIFLPKVYAKRVIILQKYLLRQMLNLSFIVINLLLEL